MNEDILNTALDVVEGFHEDYVKAEDYSADVPPAPSNEMDFFKPLQPTTPVVEQPSNDDMPEKLTLTNKCPHLAKMLYTEEDYLNNFKYDVIKKIASLPNVRYWHKNLNRRPGFCMNGFINHYPDFIVKLESGKTLLIETKGDQLANPESAAKVKLGEYWERLDKTGQYKYFMTFQNQGVEGSIPVGKLVELIGRM